MYIDSICKDSECERFPVHCSLYMVQWFIEEGRENSVCSLLRGRDPKRDGERSQERWGEQGGGSFGFWSTGWNLTLCVLCSHNNGH